MKSEKIESILRSMVSPPLFNWPLYRRFYWNHHAENV
jgi:hypothetical protein